MTSKKSARANKTPKPKISTRNKIVLQRKCACGQRTQNVGKCASCARKKPRSTLRARFQIGRPNDRFEQEAERVARQVMQMDDSVKGEAGSTQNSDTGLQENISTTNGGTAQYPSTIEDATGSKGQALDPETRAFMEPRFGHDFSAVRVHTGAQAAKSAQSVNARAYTVGQNIVFGNGEYTPASIQGRQLLAHELTHTIQQGSTSRHLQRIVQVEPHARAADDILGQFNELCSDGNFTVDSANRIQSNCARSSSLGCECLCDVTTDPARTYRIHVYNVMNIPSREMLYDGTEEMVPMPSQGPSTYVRDNPSISMPSTLGSAISFGAFDPQGRPVIFRNFRILAHELCGHARLRQDYTDPRPPLAAQVPGNRPDHDVTINTGNAITRTPVRGTFSDPRHGESFHQLPHSSAKQVFWQPDGLHHEHVP